MGSPNVIAGRPGSFLKAVLTIAAAIVALLSAGCGKDDPAKSAEARPRLSFCDYGMTVYFGAGGDSERFKLLGWSPTEGAWTWTDGIGASLAVRLAASEYPVRLSVKAAGMNVQGLLPFQPVDVAVNSHKIASWKVGDETVHTATIPQGFVRAPESFLIIDFYMPKAASPNSFGHGGDARRLGMRVVDLRFDKAPEEAKREGAQP
ncbi:MAG TPA: hypothetical protein VK993_04155 [Chthoniobacterales bacterium]|nr:hypothetical protein [Chthoniobacterales bacterium]